MGTIKKLTDRYTLVDQIARGGMGEVWEAVQRIDGLIVPCAIKLLHEDFTETARERQLFVDEARISIQLRHSCIVNVTDVGTSSDGRAFIVMDRVDGIDLRDLLGRARERDLCPLPIDLVTYIVGQLLSALQYAHERVVGGQDAGVIHSDIKPGNIMVTSSGEVVLTDFGIARFAATMGELSRSLGTPRYMSPEQLLGRPERKTDIWGVGVVLHELLEDKPFLGGLSVDQFRAVIIQGPPPGFTRGGLPSWLTTLCRRMLSSDARDRPSASEAREALVDHCPRYLAASSELRDCYYAELVGGRRSGVTKLLELGTDPAALAKLGVKAHPRVTKGDPTIPDLPTAPALLEVPEYGAPTRKRRPGSSDRAVPSERSKSRTHNAKVSDRAVQAELPPAVAQPGPEPRVVVDDPDEPTEILPVRGEGNDVPASAEPRRTLLLAGLSGSPAISSPSKTHRGRDEGEPGRPPIHTPAREPSTPAVASASRAVAPVEPVVAVADVASQPTADERVTGLDRAARWGVGIALSLVVGLLVVVAVLLLQLQRGAVPSMEPGRAATLAGRPDAPTGTAASSVRPEPAARPAGSEKDQPLAVAGSPAIAEKVEAQPPVGQVEIPPVAEPEDLQPAEPNADDPPTSAPEPPETKPKPKPKLDPVGLILIVEGSSEGHVKIDRRTVATKNKAAYVLVAPGKHRLSWRPLGQDSWQPYGKIKVRDISPVKYQVRVDTREHKLEIKELR